jgi:hypothetical protein
MEDFYLERIDSSVYNYQNYLQIERGNALVTYIPEAFHYSRFSPRFYSSSNRWQSIEIANVLNSLGYSVDMVHLESSESDLELSKYDLLFGQGSNFLKYGKQMSEDVLKIYYATSEHSIVWKHSEAQRLRDLKKRRGVNLSPEREFSNKDEADIADAIVSIGCSTISSYQSILGNQVPIHPITISTYPRIAKPSYIREKEFQEAKSNFLWFAGSGAILKRLDVVLEAFKDLHEVDLYVCGSMKGNDEFMELYQEELLSQDNIHLVGWTDITSKKFGKIVRKTAFNIYPSASDGIPSSLATTTRAGVIPIAPSDVVDITDNCGIDITDCSIDNLKDVIRTASGAPTEDVRDTAIDAFIYANTAFTRDRYSQDLLYTIDRTIRESEKSPVTKLA